MLRPLRRRRWITNDAAPARCCAFDGQYLDLRSWIYRVAKQNVEGGVTEALEIVDTRSTNLRVAIEGDLVPGKFRHGRSIHSYL